MDRENAVGGYERHGRNGQRRLVQALIAANVVAAAALAVVTLRGPDDSGQDSAVPVAASNAPVAEPPEPASEPATNPVDAVPEPAAVPLSGGTAAQAQGEGDAAAPAVAPSAAAPPATPELPGLDIALPPPAGFTPVQASTLSRSAGPFDLAVQFDPLHPTFPQSRLPELGLRATGTAAWQSPADTLVVAAYEFPDDAAAATFVAEASAPWETEPEVMPHDLHGVPDSRAFHQMGRGDHSQFALVARGTRAWVVGLTGASAADHSMELVHQTLHALGA